MTMSILLLMMRKLNLSFIATLTIKEIKDRETSLLARKSKKEAKGNLSKLMSRGMLGRKQLKKIDHNSLQEIFHWVLKV